MSYFTLRDRGIYVGLTKAKTTIGFQRGVEFLRDIVCRLAIFHIPLSEKLSHRFHLPSPSLVECFLARDRFHANFLALGEWHLRIQHDHAIPHAPWIRDRGRW